MTNIHLGNELEGLPTPQIRSIYNNLNITDFSVKLCVAQVNYNIDTERLPNYLYSGTNLFLFLNANRSKSSFLILVQ